MRISTSTSLILVSLVAFAPLLCLASVPPVKCGDTISLRSKGNYNYLAFPKTGSISAVGSIVGPENVVYLDCRDKAQGVELESGDAVSLRTLRDANSFVKDTGKGEVQPLVVGSTRSYFWVENPSNLDARTWVFSAVTAVSLRTVKDSNNFVSVSSLDGLARPASPNADQDSERFLMAVVVTDFKDRCPHDKNGDSCSGHGTCESNYCSCDSGWAGEFCEHPRAVSSCQMVGASHWRTFDNSFYDLYAAGEFLVYGEPNSQSHEAVTGVLAAMRSVSRLVSVSIRRGSDYITVNGRTGSVFVNCQSSDMSQAIGNAGASGFTTATGLNIFQDAAGWWTITSPSKLMIRYKGNTLILIVQEPLIGSARGLCGDNNGDSTNDLMPRTPTNEPDASVFNALRIENGNVYLKVNDRQPAPNGRASRSFTECKGDTTFFNFIAAEDATIHSKEALTTLSTRARVSDKAAVTGVAGQLLVENALEGGNCKGAPAQQGLALKCCAAVLVGAKVMTKDGDSVPKSTDAIRSLLDAKLKAAWSPAAPPSVNSALFETISCVSDYCNQDTCSAQSFADNVSADAAVAQTLAARAAAMAAATKLQEASKKR